MIFKVKVEEIVKIGPQGKLELDRKRLKSHGMIFESLAYMKTIKLRKISEKIINTIKKIAKRILNIEYIYGHTFISILNEYSTIVDLGAGKGTFTDGVIKMYPNARIILVEPNLDLYRGLAEKFINNKNVNVLNAVIWKEQKEDTAFYLSNSYEFSSLFKSLGELGNGIKNEIKVPAITLDDIFRIFKLSKIDLLKIDIEGSEYALFKKFTINEFKRISQISVEFHDFLEPTLRSQSEVCIKKICRLGYELFRWRNYSRVDILFYNKRHLKWFMFLRWLAPSFFFGTLTILLTFILTRKLSMESQDAREDR